MIRAARGHLRIITIVDQVRMLRAVRAVSIFGTEMAGISGRTGAIELPQTPRRQPIDMLWHSAAATFLSLAKVQWGRPFTHTHTPNSFMGLMRCVCVCGVNRCDVSQIVQLNFV